MRYLKSVVVSCILLILVGFLAVKSYRQEHRLQRDRFINIWREANALDLDPSENKGTATFYRALADAALAQTKHFVLYDSSYSKLVYPGGDVPEDRGVCADVVIRAYRALAIDLQLLVHEDMEKNFIAYPNLWQLTQPDSNIDHRRVPNLMTFFRRHNASLRVTTDPESYLEGDLVTWSVDGNRPHIGVISHERSADGKRPLVIHNIGWGVQIQDRLFEWPITGHFRYFGVR